MSREREKISFSEGGGGINIVFRPKYRPLYKVILYMGTDHYGVEVILKGTISLWIQACCFWGSIHYGMNLFMF